MDRESFEAKLLSQSGDYQSGNTFFKVFTAAAGVQLNIKSNLLTAIKANEFSYDCNSHCETSNSTFELNVREHTIKKSVRLIDAGKLARDLRTEEKKSSLYSALHLHKTIASPASSSLFPSLNNT